MQESPVRIDYALAMADGVGPLGGVREEQLDAESRSFASALAELLARVEDGQLGFWTLPNDRNQLESVRAVRRDLPDQISDVLVLGGSSLGARAIHCALSGPIELAGVAARPHTRVHFPDNSDPWLLAALLSALAPDTTAALVISKSGATLETAAQLLVVQRWFESALEAREVKRRVVAITDPEQGALRKQAAAEGWATLAIPANVGGRFSLLSPAGLLPALLGGADVDELLAGAAHMARRCESPGLRENPAGMLAALHVLQHRLHRRNLHVVMPYSDRLRPFASWYVQLWAESLGKRVNRRGQVVEHGPTPIAAVGATDQHAQLQLFMEGPRDKLVTFIHVVEGARDLVIPHAKGALSYLGGSSLHQLLEAQREATSQALANDGRPSLTVTLQRLDAFALGALFFLYEAAVALAGELYDIDAFDQPGVELGKRLAFGLLGREGYERTAQELRTAQAKRPKKYRVE